MSFDIATNHYGTRSMKQQSLVCAHRCRKACTKMLPTVFYCFVVVVVIKKKTTKKQKRKKKFWYLSLRPWTGGLGKGSGGGWVNISALLVLLLMINVKLLPALFVVRRMWCNTIFINLAFYHGVSMSMPLLLKSLEMLLVNSSIWIAW